MLIRRRITIILAAICMAAVFSSCSLKFGTETPEQTEFFAMDTYMSMTVYGDEAQKAASEAKKEIQRLDGLWSVTDSQSEIYSVNGGGETSVSGDTAELVSFMLDMAQRTGGALEPTLYPVVSAWGFTTGKYAVPNSEELKALLENVGYEKVSVSGNTISLPKGVMIDTGAVGKGFAGDRAAAVLKENGVTSALLDLGGNIQLIGDKPDGSSWRIGLRDPNGSGELGVIEASDCAIVTSGLYERNFTADDGTIYGHIIDPESGMPVDNDLLSVTVIAKEGKLCDALSTALFVMGKDGAVDYWRQHRDFDMLLVCKDGQIYITGGAADSFTPDKNHKDITVNVID